MQPQQWNIKEFRELINEQVTPRTIENIDVSLKAILWKINLCKYHIEEYKRVMQESYKSDIDRSVQVTGKILHMAAGTEEGKEYYIERFIAEAHIIAFAQALHSIADIFAHVLYHSLEIESIDVERIDLSKVTRKMEELNIAPEVTRLLKVYQNSEQFKYLRAFVNTTKHRSLVHMDYTANFVEWRHGLEIKQFHYKSETYLKKWADDFTDGDFNELLNMLQAIGVVLNEHLDIT